jgi:hypothetical protein
VIPFRAISGVFEKEDDMKHLLLALAIAGTSVFGQTSPTVTTTPATLPSLTPAQRLGIQQQMTVIHTASINSYFSAQKSAVFTSNRGRSVDAISRQVSAMNLVKHGVSYHMSVDPNTGALVIGAPENNSALPPADTKSPSTSATPEGYVPPPPSIMSLDFTDLTPNIGPPIDGLHSMITITGQNFGTPVAPDYTPPGEVHFILPGGTDVKATIALWSNNWIQAILPAVTGVFAGSGTVYVQTTSRTRGFTFNFTPAMEERALAPDYQHFAMATGCLDDISRPPDASNPGVISVFHDANPFIGCKGDDQVFVVSPPLMNSWVVSRVILTTYADAVAGTNAAVSVVESHPGTSNLYSKVHWWANMANNAYYDFSAIIRGPAGTNP